MEKVSYIWKIKILDREPSTMIQTFSPLLMFEYYLEVFIDVWLSLEKSIAEFSMVYKK